jgi:hypothetical protein
MAIVKVVNVVVLPDVGSIFGTKMELNGDQFLYLLLFGFWQTTDNLKRQSGVKLKNMIQRYANASVLDTKTIGGPENMFTELSEGHTISSFRVRKQVVQIIFKQLPMR